MKPTIYIRKATYDDIPALMLLFESAKGIMRASGNLHQWGVGYPSVEVVSGDIERGTPIHSSHIGLYDLAPALCIAPKMNSQV